MTSRKGNDNDKSNDKSEIQGSLHCGGFAAFGRDDVFGEWFGRGQATAKTTADPYGMTNKEATAKAKATATASATATATATAKATATATAKATARHGTARRQ